MNYCIVTKDKIDFINYIYISYAPIIVLQKPYKTKKD